MLLVEADGHHDTLPYLLQALATAAEGEGLIALDVAMEGAAREKLWAARKALSPALRSIAPGKINEDVVVPVSRIPDLVAGVQALARDYTLTIVTFGHAGNGNLHVNILYHPDDADENARAHAALRKIFELTLALGGKIQQHGRRAQWSVNRHIERAGRSHQMQSVAWRTRGGGEHTLRSLGQMAPCATAPWPSFNDEYCPLRCPPPPASVACARAPASGHRAGVGCIACRHGKRGGIAGGRHR